MCGSPPSLPVYPEQKNPSPSSSPPATGLWRRVRRMKPMDKPLLFGLFSLSALCFLCCFLYLEYRTVLVNGGGLGFRHWQLPRRQRLLDLKFRNGGSGEECDLFVGKWVWDESYPLYESRDCGFLDEGFRCSENGRSDNLYTKWRWQPAHCNLPRFDGKVMLERLRNRRLVFVGDSIGRNQWESLLCMLSSAVADKSSIYEVNGSPITKHNGFLVFKFKHFNCTVEYYRAPFLVLQSRAPAAAPKRVRATLKLDTMDWTSNRWRDADVLIFNTGHWWNYEKTIRGGCYFQEGIGVKMNMSVESAYRRSMDTLFNWINREVNTRRTHIIYRTYAPVHFSGGDWKTGGNCHMETLPETSTTRVPSTPADPLLSTVMDVLSQRTSKSPAAKLDVLNVTHMTAQRKDGHSSLYYMDRKGHAPLHRQDCSHWCLPGVPDTWNELVFALFMRHSSASHGI